MLQKIAFNLSSIMRLKNYICSYIHEQSHTSVSTYLVAEVLMGDRSERTQTQRARVIYLHLNSFLCCCLCFFRLIP